MRRASFTVISSLRISWPTPTASELTLICGSSSVFYGQLLTQADLHPALVHRLKICDFGLARPFLGEETPTAWTDYVATRWYRAPELCGCFYGCYSHAVDIWSIGCIFAETLLGKPLFPGRDAVAQLQIMTDLLGKPPPHVIERIGNQKARSFLHALPPKVARPFEQKFRNADRLALDLLQQLLAFDPADRPSASQALEHPYFQVRPEKVFSFSWLDIMCSIAHCWTFPSPQGLPKVAPVECAPVSRGDFEFEMHKLTEADVRNLIYMEVGNFISVLYFDLN